MKMSKGKTPLKSPPKAPSTKPKMPAVKPKAVAKPKKFASGGLASVGIDEDGKTRRNAIGNAGRSYVRTTRDSSTRTGAPMSAGIDEDGVTRKNPIGNKGRVYARTERSGSAPKVPAVAPQTASGGGGSGGPPRGTALQGLMTPDGPERPNMGGPRQVPNGTRLLEDIPSKAKDITPPRNLPSTEFAQPSGGSPAARSPAAGLYRALRAGFKAGNLIGAMGALAGQPIADMAREYNNRQGDMTPPDWLTGPDGSQVSPPNRGGPPPASAPEERPEEGMTRAERARAKPAPVSKPRTTPAKAKEGPMSDAEIQAWNDKRGNTGKVRSRQELADYETKVSAVKAGMYDKKPDMKEVSSGAGLYARGGVVKKSPAQTKKATPMKMTSSKMPKKMPTDIAKSMAAKTSPKKPTAKMPAMFKKGGMAKKDKC